MALVYDDNKTGAGAFLSALGLQGPQLADLSKRYNPTGAIDYGQSDEMRKRQGALATMLEEQAAGQGPSIAQQQLQRGTEAAMAQAAALGRSQAGQGAGLQQRNIAQQQAQIGQQAASDSAMVRMQEQLQARSALGNILQGARGQDIQSATERARLQQEAERDKYGALERQQQRELDIKKGEQESRKGLIGGVVQSIATGALGASDERLKENVSDAGPAIDRMLSSLAAKSYDYKEPEVDGGGRRTGVMAQDLEKSDLGERLVMDTARGKYVNYERALPLLLASAARLSERLDSFENSKTRKAGVR